jgi:hypothetical protein
LEKGEKMKQVELTRGNTQMVTWTDEDPRLKQGNHLSFKGENVKWNITKVYDKSLDKGDIKRSWHVGGL